MKMGVHEEDEIQAQDDEEAIEKENEFENFLERDND